MLTTVQDLGRPEAQHYGVPVGGAMDRFALIAANRLVSNPIGAAALELTAGGCAFELLAALMVAITGAELNITLDGEPLPTWTTIFARSGQSLELTERSQPWGARAYLAIAGGLDVPEMLGSRSTSLAGTFGGVEGRPLRAGDLLAVDMPRVDVLREAGRTWPAQARPPYSQLPTLRILPGPHSDLFDSATVAALLARAWQISSQSNRMGYRLEGGSLPNPPTSSIPSHGVVPGAIQIPPDGGPILLTADAQTTGGYPIIGVVVGADLPLAAQLLPGDQLRFDLTTVTEAVAAWKALKAWEATPLGDNGIVGLLAWAAALDLPLVD